MSQAFRLLAALSTLAMPSLGYADPVQATLYSFKGEGDGGQPSGPLVLGRNDVLYGTTAFGGVGNKGVVFKLTPPSREGEAWIETTLYAFRGGRDGEQPAGGVIASVDGALYGVTSSGGDLNGDGTAFMLFPPAAGGGVWHESVLHRFSEPADGIHPGSELTLDAHGNLFGTTTKGGAHGLGVIYRLEPPHEPGRTWTETVLYSFRAGPACNSPSGRLNLDIHDEIYGLGSNGGAEGLGCFYRLMPPAHGVGEWIQTVAYSFHGQSDGSHPSGSLISDGAGGLYGATVGEPSRSSGTIFSLHPPRPGHADWQVEPIYRFPEHGRAVAAGLARDDAGSLFGGSIDFTGVYSSDAFQLSPPRGGATSWTLRSLFGFNARAVGQGLFNPLSVDTHGVIYGTTTTGGRGYCFAEGCGTVFRIVP